LHLGNEGLAALGLGYIVLPLALQVVSRLTGLGPMVSTTIANYDVRGVENMELGPSFIWFETCYAAWIDGRHPQTCLSQAYLHAGATGIVISTTPSSVPGGYLEPYRPHSTVLGIIPGYLKAIINARRGIFPEHHFGEKLYADMLEDLHENDVTLGTALRNARNRYLPEDIDYSIYWTPPLGLTGQFFKKYDKQPFVEHKYVNYQEFLLYGDPAFNPYEPCNLG